MRVFHKACEVFADYHQFYLWDAGMAPVAPEDYTDDDVQRRIKTGPHVIVIQPARNTTIPLEVEIHDAEPTFNPEDWDHIAEASLHLPTGKLQVHECTGGPVAEFQVTPGWYRVRCFHGGLATVDEFGQEGEDHYHADLWPASPYDVQIVKQWRASA